MPMPRKMSGSAMSVIVLSMVAISMPRVEHEECHPLVAGTWRQGGDGTACR